MDDFLNKKAKNHLRRCEALKYAAPASTSISIPRCLGAIWTLMIVQIISYEIYVDISKPVSKLILMLSNFITFLIFHTSALNFLIDGPTFITPVSQLRFVS